VEGIVSVLSQNFRYRRVGRDKEHEMHILVTQLTREVDEKGLNKKLNLVIQKSTNKVCHCKGEIMSEECQHPWRTTLRLQ
jgi:hypothetical protein